MNELLQGRKEAREHRVALLESLSTYNFTESAAIVARLEALVRARVPTADTHVTLENLVHTTRRHNVRLPSPKKRPTLAEAVQHLVMFCAAEPAPAEAWVVSEFETEIPSLPIVESMYRRLLAQPARRPTLTSADLALLSCDYGARDGCKFAPSPFQARILDVMAQNRLQGGPRRGLACLATGLGKTILALLDLDSSLRQQTDGFKTDAEIVQSEQPLRVLFVSHTTQIRSESFKKFKEHFGPEGVGFPAEAFLEVGTGNQTITENTKFIFLLWQSFAHTEPSVYAPVTHLILDEVHHLLAPTYAAVFRALALSSPVVLGLTATLRHRDDLLGNRLREIFEQNVYVHFDWLEAMKSGFFPPVRYLEAVHPLVDKFVIDYDNLIASDNASLIVRRMNNSLSHLPPSWRSLQLSPSAIANTYIDLMALSPRSRTLIFVSSIGEADEVTALLRARGVAADAAHYGRGQQARAALQDLRAGKLAVVTTVMMATEGFDLPEIDGILLARVTQSETVFVQQMGRGLRRSPLKQDVIIVDLAYNLRRRWVLQAEVLAPAELVAQVHGFWTLEKMEMDIKEEQD